MLTKEEQDFIHYWEQNRNRKKRVINYLAAGLPLAVLLAGGIFVSYFSGWYTRAVMRMNANVSGLLIMFLALILIVFFIIIFSSKHKWDLNEQRYRELLAKRDGN